MGRQRFGGEIADRRTAGALPLVEASPRREVISELSGWNYFLEGK